jgi:hypothetical protein
VVLRPRPELDRFSVKRGRADAQVRSGPRYFLALTPASNLLFSSARGRDIHIAGFTVRSTGDLRKAREGGRGGLSQRDEPVPPAEKPARVADCGAALT